MRDVHNSNKFVLLYNYIIILQAKHNKHDLIILQVKYKHSNRMKYMTLRCVYVYIK